MFASLLIANRGEIAVRIARTARRLGIRTVAVHSREDRDALHVAVADEAREIGGAAATESYLRGERIVEVARDAGAEAVHPGYGFLSENAGFAEACAAAGLVFVGPPPAAIRAMGLKDEAKTLMQKAGVPVVPGYNGPRQEPEFLREKAYELGYPVLIKALAGGGGRGMRRVDRALDFEDALAAARREAKAAFGDDRVLVEKFVPAPRHIEIQVFADAHGNVVHLGERDCSLQRRHQKVIEEAPAPGVTEELRAAMGEAAVAAARAVGYVGAGTVEFVVDATKGLRPDAFYFMEMNARLQVEHPVTEAVTGLDLVEWQLRVAAGEHLPLEQEDIRIEGHAIEARLYAEDPDTGFLPSTGVLAAFDLADGEGVRVDSGVRAGDRVTSHYDPMLAKVVAYAPDRAGALARLDDALVRSLVAGPRTNLAFLRRLIGLPAFHEGTFHTGLVDDNIAALLARPDGEAAAAAACGVMRLIAREQERLAALPAAHADPWNAFDGFQLGGPRRHGVRVEVDGVPTTFEIEWRGGEPTVVAPDGAARSAADAALVDVPAGVLVLVGGRQYVVRAIETAVQDRVDTAAEATVRAPMHGRVVGLEVQDGDRVETGRRLAVIEAMKMEHALLAPRGGTVADLTVALGDQVGEGQKLFVVRADD